ncbi:MAG: cytochrome b [Advenella sp.]|nr:cytochrome b [Advenella sp.]
MSDTPQRYGSFTRWLHWGMALLIIWQFLKLGDLINEGEHWVGQTLVPWHISIGVLILILGIVRIYWAIKQSASRPPLTGPLAPLAKIGHFLLYLLLLLLPVLGIMYMVGKGYGLKVFGMQLIARSETEIGWMASAGSLHAPVALLFLLLVIGHIGAALYHHFILRDDTLKRMTR